MAYKFQIGDFQLGDADSAGDSLRIQGELSARADAAASIEAEKIDAQGDLTCVDDLIAGSLKVCSNTNGSDDKTFLQIEDSNADKLVRARIKNSNAQLDLYANNANVIQLDSGDPSDSVQNAGTAGKHPFLVLKQEGGTIGIEAQGRDDGGRLKTVKIGGTAGNGDVKISTQFGNGDLLITGANGSEATLSIEGGLDVKGNLDANTDLITIKDKLVQIDAAAADTANSLNSAIEIGNHAGIASNGGQKMIFKTFAGTADNGMAFENANGSAGGRLFAEQYIGLVDQMTNVPSAALDNDGIPKFVFASQTGATLNLEAADISKVQLLNRNGAMQVNLPAQVDVKVGQIYRLKAGANCSTTNKYTITADGSEKIGCGSDGAGVASIILESPFAAIDLVCLGSITASTGGAVTRWGLF